MRRYFNETNEITPKQTRCRKGASKHTQAREQTFCMEGIMGVGSNGSGRGRRASNILILDPGKNRKTPCRYAVEMLRQMEPAAYVLSREWQREREGQRTWDYWWAQQWATHRSSWLSVHLISGSKEKKGINRAPGRIDRVNDFSTQESVHKQVSTNLAEKHRFRGACTRNLIIICP